MKGRNAIRREGFGGGDGGGGGERAGSTEILCNTVQKTLLLCRANERF
jgi:hypothetical protein